MGRPAFAALLVDQLRVLGPEHSDTLSTRHQFAHWTQAAGCTQPAADDGAT